MSQVRIFALGGLDEDGKNMYVVEVEQSIFVIEAGLKYPDTDQHGIEMIIPDFKYLIENKDRVKGIFITHGHDDVMAALGNLLKKVKIPVYTTALTAAILEAKFKKEEVKDYEIHRIKRNGNLKIAGHNILTFSMTQSIADGFGIAIDTKMGYVVYTSEFIVDYDIHHDAFACDITYLAEIGKKGVFALLTESVGAIKTGHTAPNHKITSQIEPHFEDSAKRIIITTYQQNIFRLIEIIELANKYKKKVIFFDEHQRSILKMVEDLGYYKIPVGLELKRNDPESYNKNVVVIVSASGAHVFKSMLKIALKEETLLELRPDDTVIIASPIVPGTEKEASKMENEIYKEDVKVVTLDKNKVFAMHASAEDIKMMIYLFKPKYYIPIKGEYRHLIANANIAMDMGLNATKIIILDNGQIAKFENGKCIDVAEIIHLEESMVAGKNNLDVSGMVLRDREILSTDGAVIVGVVVDYKTKKVIGGPDVQTRGVIYLKDADYIVRGIGEIIEKTINDAVSEKRYENILVRNEARDKIARYMSKETGKRPMILPAIVEINTTE